MVIEKTEFECKEDSYEYDSNKSVEDEPMLQNVSSI